LYAVIERIHIGRELARRIHEPLATSRDVPDAEPNLPPGGMPMIRDLAPDIVRQRLLIEGFYSCEMNSAAVTSFLQGLAAMLGLRTYGAPIIFSPGDGTGKLENAGFDAFVPLIDSGIAMYVWTSRRFFSVVLYTCKQFDVPSALAFTKQTLGVAAEAAWLEF
jgi:hypothetical protein